MPPRKVYRKKAVAKKIFKTKPTRRFHKKNPVVSCRVTKSLTQGWPDRYFCKLASVYTQNMTCASGGNNAFGVAGNFLHNMATGVITGANQLTISNFGTSNLISGLGGLLNSGSSYAPYQNYRIHSCLLRLDPQNIAGSGNPVTLTVLPITAQNATNTPNVNAYSLQISGEQPYIKTWTLAGTQMNKGPRCIIGMGTRRMFGLKYKAAMEDNIYAGVYGTNPGSQWFFYVLADPLTSNNSPIDVVVRATYTIEFFGRNFTTGLAG